MSLFLFLTSSTLFFWVIFLRKKFSFGFKESFAIGLIFYIHIPLILVYFYNYFLLSNFKFFNGYSDLDIIKAQYLTAISLFSFLLGYTLTKNEFFIFSIKKNFSYKQIIFAIIITFIFFLIDIPVVQAQVIIFTLLCLLIYSSELSNKKKLIFIALLAIIFMYLSAIYFSNRRDIVKILIIALFFISLFYSSKKTIYSVFIILLPVTFLIVFLSTNLRTFGYDYDNVSLQVPSMKALISNYDFMPAFDHMIYLINNNESLLYGKSVFKIFFSFIPRDIWPSKPLDTNILIVELRDNPFVGGSSQSITFLGEIYWNFGSIGSVIFFYLIGILSKSFDIIKVKKLTDMQLIILSSLSYLMFMIWRGSISTTFVIFLINLLYFFLILILSDVIFKRKTLR